MSKSSVQYNIYGRTKGRKKINDSNLKKLNKYRINLNTHINKNKKIVIDIGSGYGESSIFLAQKYLEALIISCDRFKDGNISLVNQINNSKIKNIKIFDGNIIQFFDNLKINHFINEIWILFPDPWPKKRHHKRRLINEDFFLKINPFLRKNAKIFISTDSQSYLFAIINTVYNIKKFYKWENDNPHDWLYRLQDLPLTKFYIKAEKSNRSPFFIQLIKI